MSTKNPRINVTFDEATAAMFARMALHEHKSVSSLVRELAQEALERREDMYLSTLADKIDIPGLKTVRHEDAWL